jgi:hypothetical protein
MRVDVGRRTTLERVQTLRDFFQVRHETWAVRQADG